MWGSPKLPPAARTMLANYVTEKSQGAYGHKEGQCKRFIDQFRGFDLFTEFTEPGRRAR